MKDAVKPKHEAFIEEFLKDRNAAAAAQRAGYSPRSAAGLMAMEHIREEIRRRQEEIARDAGVNLQSLIREAEAAREVAEQAGNASAMDAAIKLKAELTGVVETSVAPFAMELEPAAHVIGGMRATLFHNPTAGHKATKDDILAAMKLADFDVRYVSVKDGNLEEAFEKKADLLVVAGGDGTIAEVLTRLPDRAMPVALLPLGTANNIARSLGIAGTPQELVETWKIDNTHPLDVGRVKASWGTSRFLEGFGVGVFAEFLKAADKGEKAKGADNLRKGRALLVKQVKGAKPIELSIKIDGKTFNGEFLGVEVMNVPFTGPGLPLATKAHVADGLLDVVCFDAARRRDFEQWLDAPQDAQAPVTARQGKTIELVWADTANRLDDESYGNRDKKQVAEIACEKDKLKVLIPVKHPSQKAVGK